MSPVMSGALYVLALVLPAGGSLNSAAWKSRIARPTEAELLDSSPDVWIVDGSQLLFLTDSGLWSTDGFKAQKLHDVDLGGFAPTSLARAGDGSLVVGMRHYVLKLSETARGWEERWLTSSDCQKVRLKSYTCECAP